LQPVRRALFLVPLVLLASACGAKTVKKTTGGPPNPAVAVGIGAKTLYNGGDWAVVTRGTKVVVAHLVGGVWKVDASGKVKVSILGPTGTAASIPQVAAAIKGPSTIIEDALWVDGKELLEKGGGLKPSNITIYGAPDKKLRKGTHVAIAYGRTATSGTAVRWTFRVV
jgi:hypothetical protein